VNWISTQSSRTIWYEQGFQDYPGQLKIEEAVTSNYNWWTSLPAWVKNQHGAEFLYVVMG